MLDTPLRRALAPFIERAARPLAARRIGADAITLFGLAAGLAAVPLLAFRLWLPALALILLSRVADGLDGAVARLTAASDRGGYLDIVCDFVFYAAVPFGFALAAPSNAVPAAFLIFAFVGTGTSFLAYAVFAAKRGLADPAPPATRRSFLFLGGLTEGSETIAAFAAFCLFPASFPALAYAFGALCWLTTAARVRAALRAFRD
ncbi:MAG: CDP-alcohol phosphatidyltransferase family protein [Rhodospirillaceae bacterium]|nr:CDP-alcohol phosphatidyltransferase family protein [Rhodospirillaceae bacterium]